MVAYTSSAAQRALVCNGLKQVINPSCSGVSPNFVDADSCLWAQLHSSLIKLLNEMLRLGADQKSMRAPVGYGQGWRR